MYGQTNAGGTKLTINRLSWSDKWKIPDGTDFNTIKTVGVWFTESDVATRNMPNAPNGSNAYAGTLEVIVPLQNIPVGTVIDGNWRYMTQRWTTWGGEVWSRPVSSNGSGVWTYGTWVTYATKAEMDYAINNINSLITSNYRALQLGFTNYGTTLTLQGATGGNSAGLVITGQGTSVALWVFSYRTTTQQIYLHQVFGNNNVTLTGTITAGGVITLTASDGTQMTAIYSR